MPRFDEKQLRDAMAASLSWSESLRRLGYQSAGGNWRTLQKYAALWGISSDHFDPIAATRQTMRRRRPGVPLAEVMIENSTYKRAHLKRRLFENGIKERRCEMCGQGEIWRGSALALILDHINGIPNDHRLENLRILCPNCAATLITHCGRKNLLSVEPRNCLRCGKEFRPKHRATRYCSQACGCRWDRSKVLRGVPNLRLRKVERPPYEQLLREIEQTSYLAVGRKYGVSGNAIRKWVAFYERQRARMDGDGG